MAGVAVAGSLVADVIKMISHYPERECLRMWQIFLTGLAGVYLIQPSV